MKCTKREGERGTVHSWIPKILIRSLDYFDQPKLALISAHNYRLSKYVIVAEYHQMVN